MGLVKARVKKVVGEEIRMTAAALEAVRVTAQVVEKEKGRNVKDKNNDT